MMGYVHPFTSTQSTTPNAINGDANMITEIASKVGQVTHGSCVNLYN